MKRAVFLLMSTFLILTISTTAWSLPYTGADITLKGTDFASISNGVLGTTPVSGGNEWYAEGDSIWTAWSNQWVTYTTHLTAGKWNIGLNVINHGNIGTGDWYTHFEILNSSTLQTMTMTVLASDTEAFPGFIETDIETDGAYTVRYTWLNDKYAPDDGLDANIEITSVFFDDKGTAPVPEPATMMLFGIGLLGLAGVSRRKK